MNEWQEWEWRRLTWWEKVERRWKYGARYRWAKPTLMDGVIVVGGVLLVIVLYLGVLLLIGLLIGEEKRDFSAIAQWAA